MQVSLFENAYFLRTLGWAIINNLWQSGILWLLYLAIIKANKNLNAGLKYYCSLSFLFLSFLCFIINLLTNLSPDTKTTSLLTGNIAIILKQSDIIFPYLALIYCVVLAFFVSKYIIQLLHLNFIRTNGLIEAPKLLQDFANKTAEVLGIKNNITVKMSTFIEVPSVIGFLKPIILLPFAMMNNLTVEQATAVITHEIAHIKRNDFLINILQSFVEMVLLFNPFALLLGKAVKKEREHCCDDTVINYRFNKIVYANALVIIEEQRKHHVAFAITATDNKNLLLRRIKRLFTVPNQSVGVNNMQRILIGMGCLFTVSILLFYNASIHLHHLKGGKNSGNGIDRTWVIPAKIIMEQDYTQQKNLISMPVLKEINPKIVSNPIDLRSTAKVAPLENSKGLKKPKGAQSKEYVLALINQDLLVNDQQKLVASAILNKETAIIKTSIISIQDQQSGTKLRKTYYLKLTNKDGKKTIQPLLVIVKYNSGNLDSSKSSSKKMLNSKKSVLKRRVTT